MRRQVFPIISVLYLTAIYGLPCVTAAVGALHAPVWLGCLSVPWIWVSSFVTVAGALSLPHRKGIVPGTFPRSLDHPVYFHRRLYGLCWTSLYYCTPVYHLCLSVRPLKALAFRLFGYRGNLDFTVYPDTWIRDLPLLELAEGAYVSNRATLGTNIVLSNGDILVDRIVVGRKALVGHLAKVAPGVELGEHAEVGVGSAIGIGARLGAGARVGAECSVDTGARIEAKASVGNQCYLGRRSVVPAGERIAPGSVLRVASFRLGDVQIGISE
jgi:carbonic anhydrase/acetyltransferase-like protein (isoleucine patch superfamily)